MRHRKKSYVFTMLLVPLVSMTGCATVIEEIQTKTGSQIEEIDKLVATQPASKPASEEQETQTNEQKMTKSPAPNTDLSLIIEDEGKGEYASSSYKPAKVNRALQQMPKGLSKDKAYAYLLGLVGENYKEDVSQFVTIENRDYKKIIEANQANFLPQPEPKVKKEQANTNETNVQDEKRQKNIIILLDASGSMAAEIDGVPKMELAKKVISQITEQLDAQKYQVQVYVYGHTGSNASEGKEESCSNADLIYHDNQQNLQLADQLAQIEATGWTPLALTIDQVRDHMQKQTASEENKIILVGDGTENCDQDALMSARMLRYSDVRADISMIGLSLNAKDENELREIVDVTGGVMQNIEDPKRLHETASRQLQWMTQTDRSWEESALRTLSNAYQYDQERLLRHREKLLKKVTLENERLLNTKSYVIQSQKLDSVTDDEIQKWIEDRKQQMEHYIDRKYQEGSDKLYQKWQQNIEKVRGNETRPTIEKNVREDYLNGEQTE
ncbi:VWA domain-containing protein [Hazenella sp. IB182357]|uniref:VWA domain-containing protein n=1 Tax=Polycladospora coralii TaxID=2771432 RepID=A0A926RV47_9BACL|nr:vWA domain-containing protein [Polycladospora coralii]MBD1373169.1 VWA domain-containing protein [Polycladospora coralii]